MTAMTGPLTQAKQSLSNPRGFFNNAPMGFDPDFFEFADDFSDLNSVASTGRWKVVKDTGAAVALAAGHTGLVTLTSAATTENDGACISLNQELVSLASGKKVWFETRVKTADADQMDLFFGFATIPSTFDDPEDIIAEVDLIGFVVEDGSASIKVQAKKDNTGAAVASGSTLSDDTFVKLGMYFDGTQAHFYVDRQYKKTLTANIPDNENLTLALFSLSGKATGTCVTTVDYVYVIATR